VDGEAVLSAFGGSAMVRYAYDAQGRLTRVAHYGLRDEPIVSPVKGYHARAMTYDRWGNCHTQRFLDVDGELMVSPVAGYARAEAACDPRGLILELRYMDADGGLTNRADGAARVVFTYDPYWRVVAGNAYDKDGRPVGQRPAPQNPQEPF
jgi:uncharacterized protein RhaS with RHS repeats